MSSVSFDNTNTGSDHAVADLLQRRIMNALQGPQFGSVEIVVHDGRVVQIERRERLRLERERRVGPVD